MKRFFIILSCLLASFTLAGQNSIRVQAPNLVSEGEQFNVTFIIDGETAPSDFSWSPGDDFQLVWGPQKGSSTSISIVNGKKTKSSQTTYTYVLLPRKTGTFTLPAATASFKGDSASSPRHSIEVFAGSAPSGSRQQGGGSQASGTSVSGEDLFIRMIPSKTRVVVGEPLTVTFKLFTRIDVAGYEDLRFPEFEGFWVQDLPGPSSVEFRREKYGDQIYNAAVLRSCTLIPQQSGQLTVGPAEMVCQIMVRAPRSSGGGIFDSFFQDDYRTIRKRISSGETTFRVSPLPAGAPASFGGGVGSFKITSALTKDSLRTHDAASLKITVSGRGNLSMLDAPKVNFPPDFEVYDIKTTENSDKSSGRLSGSKTFEYPFIPRSHGEFTIPPVEYSYYDSAAGKYVTLRTAQMTLSVSRGNEPEAAANPGGQLVQGVDRRDVRDLGSDIRFIATKLPRLRPAGHFFVGSPAFLAAAALLLLAAAAVYIVLRSMAARRADVVGTRVRGASRMARGRLSKAGQYLKDNLYSAFYEELHKAILGFVSDKLNMDVYEMDKDTISERLTSAGVSEGLARDCISLLEACEFARYSSAPEGRDEMNARYSQAVAVISGIDASLNRRPSRRPVSAALAAVLLLSAAPGLSAAAPAADSLWNAAVAAYADGRWADAADGWNAVLDLGLSSPQLYYNLGNARFKEGNHAQAILNYERALKLDPSYSDARFNLEFANAFVQDRIEVLPEFFLRTWARKLRWVMPSDAWAALFLVFFAGFLAMLLLFLLSGSSAGRKTGFFLGLALMLLSAVCLDSSLRQRREALGTDKAIVTVPVAPVRSAPGTDVSRDLFILHEGTKVVILETLGEWREVEIADGRRGWLRAGACEII